VQQNGEKAPAPAETAEPAAPAVMEETLPAAVPEKSSDKAVAETPEDDKSSDTPLLGDVPPDPVEEKSSGKAPRSSRKNEEKDPDGEDDLGIIQPEFGF
jgi:hypothetical protein